METALPLKSQQKLQKLQDFEPSNIFSVFQFFRHFSILLKISIRFSIIH